MVAQAREISQVTADILDSNNRTVSAGDITASGLGKRDIWVFGWNWNATTLQLSDDKSFIMDAGESSVPGLLYLDQSVPPVQVSVVFNSTGKNQQNHEQQIYLLRFPQ